MERKNHTFQGHWITAEKLAGLDPIPVFGRQLGFKPPQSSRYQNQHILFRRTFSLPSASRVMLYISADDYYKLYVNGRFVTQGPAPGYPFYYYYNAVDLTPYIRPGENTLAVHTYYQGLINRVWVSGDNRHGLILDLLADGELVLKSDPSFLCAEHTGYTGLGVTGYDTQFLERYDSGAPEAGFERPDFDDSAWGHAVIHQKAAYTLYEQPTRQLDIHPVKPAVQRREGNRLWLDFGRQYVGYLTAKAQGERGGRVVIRCGQELNPDGSVRFDMRCNCRYEEEWILSGGQDTLRQYDYKSFRYAELELPAGCRIEPGSVQLLARHYPFEQKALPNTADPDLLRVWNLCADSLHYGVQEVVQDCMDREKGCYLGDGCYSVLALTLLTGDTAMMEKFIDDSLRTGFINKGLMTCAACSFMQEIAEYPLMLPWLVLAHYILTGDREFLRRHHRGITELLGHYRSSYATPDGLLANLDKWCVVEWPAEARDGYDVDLTQGQICTEKHNVINAYYIGAVKALNRINRILGLEPFADADTLKAAFIQAFYDPHAGLFRDSVRSSHISMPGNAFALLFSLCPDTPAEQRVVELIRTKRLHSSMFFVTFAILAALKRLGEHDLCLSLIADPDGWLNMLREGATATFEGWGKDSKWNTSLFHLAFTYPILFLTDWGMERLFE